MPEDKLKKVNELLKMINNSLTKEQFDDNFKQVLDLVKKVFEKNTAEFGLIKSTIDTLTKKLESDSTTTNDKLQRQVTAELESVLRRFSAKIKEVDAKVAEVKDGEDGVGIKGDKGDKGDKGEQGSPAKVTEFKKTLEKELKDLKEEIKKLKKRGTGGGHVGSVGAGGGRIVRQYDLSSKLNGVLKTFSLPVFWRVISVHASSFPNALRETTDYTVDGSAFTITFTSEIGASTTLSAGQTLFIIYSE